MSWLSAVRAFLIPPREDVDASRLEAMGHMKRVGMAALGVVAMLAPVADAMTALGAHYFDGESSDELLAAHLASNLVVAVLGGLVLAGSRIPRAVEHGRLLVGVVALLALASITRVYLLRGDDGPRAEPPYMLLLVLATMSYRPSHAFALTAGLAAVVLAVCGIVPYTDGLPLPRIFTAKGLYGFLSYMVVLGAVMAVIAGFLYRFRMKALDDWLERERLHAQFEASERKYRTLLDQLSDAVFLIDDHTGHIHTFNPSLTRILGVPPEAAMGMHFTRHIHPDDLERVIHNHLARMRGEPVPNQYRIKVVRGDGEVRICELQVQRSADHGGTVGSMRDITDQVRLEESNKAYLRELEQKHREVRETQAQLVQSGKMAALGSLVAGVAHEINTPVGAIHSNADTARTAIELLRNELSVGELGELAARSKKVQRALSVLSEGNDLNRLATDRIVTIVRSLRSFARLDEAEQKQADLHEGLESTLTLLHHALKKRIEVVREYGQLPLVTCSPNQINQVFMNVLQNAAQAIDGPGKIVIRTRRDGEFVELEFEDSGKGIAPADLPRIFDPGFTTKGVGVGTGLGLSITYRIVNEHKGTIFAKSEPGRGATFVIRLPIGAAAEPAVVRA